MASFWFKVYSSINERNIIIQSRGISLEIEIDLIKDLIIELKNIRNKYPTILNEASLVANLNLLPCSPDEGKRSKKKNFITIFLQKL
jgi:hypothetical protein